MNRNRKVQIGNKHYIKYDDEKCDRDGYRWI